MAGNIVAAVGKSTDDRALGMRWVAEVRRQAQGAGVTLPNDIEYSGSYGQWISMSYTSNAMRDIVLQAARDVKLTPLRGHHCGRYVDYP